ncbi:magnesium transporter [Brachyspira hyodysenteriae]|uniref:magnesium transporter n=1 Tax=Brachyspira hyodysenteriae TaxID=159 RepID=UPI0022CDCC8C|nr:magnesium transporter [Brachyspira hyodysenteriae]MDA0079372.1 magnesium transporter [Brachyspira hyodysenteriae]
MLKELLQPEIEDLIEEKEWEALSDILPLWQEVETANLITSLKNDDKYKVFSILPKDYYYKVFPELAPIDQQRIIENMQEADIKDLLENINPDDRTYFLASIPETMSESILKLLGSEEREIASWLLAYPEGSIGRLMTPEYISIKPDWTVSEAFEYVRSNIEESETYTTLYVTDARRTLIGSIALRKLFFTDKNTLISEITNNCPYISAYEDQENAIDIIKKYNLYSLAVVDDRHSMIGIVTVDDIMDIAEEEYTDDFHKMAGITSSEDQFDDNLKITPISTLYKQRILWLLILVFINIFSGGVIGIFQNTLQKHIVLVVFLPLLIGSGGNAGSQSATLVIRSLAIGDVVLKDWFYMLSKELLVASMLGLSMAVGAYLLGIIRGGLEIAAIVSISMFSIVFIGSVIGLCLPFILTKFNIDPAISGAPMLTSICDIVGTALYCSIATLAFIIFF